MKNLKTKKGFTLIELLAVIVILGVLMMIAIPSMTRVIENARKNTYVSTAKSFSNQVRYEALQDTYPLPAAGKYIAVATDQIKLEKGSKRSSFGADFVKEKSYVIIVNDGVAENAATEADYVYVYFIAMTDAKGNGFVLTEESGLAAGDILKGKAGNDGQITPIASLPDTLQASAFNVKGVTLKHTSFTKKSIYQ